MSEEFFATILAYWFPLMGISLVVVGGWCFTSEFQFHRMSVLGVLMGITLAVFGVFLLFLPAFAPPSES